MLAIKLRLIGKKGQHSFRVIVQEKRAKLQGKFNDDLGWYNPHTNQFKIDQTKLTHWLENGAQPTESVRSILAKATDNSEIQEYPGRKTPKKKKKEKIEKATPPTVEAEEASEVTQEAQESEATQGSPEEEGTPEAEQTVPDSEESKDEEPKEEVENNSEEK